MSIRKRKAKKNDEIKLSELQISCVIMVPFGFENNKANVESLILVMANAAQQYVNSITFSQLEAKYGKILPDSH